MKNRLPLALVLGVFLGGCSSLPRDAAGSTQRIRETRVLLAGVAAEPDEQEVARRERALLEALAKRLGARLEIRRGNAHALLEQLSEAQLFVVAAQLPSDTPFAEHVALSQPFFESQDNKSYCLAVAPGENRMLLSLDKIIAARKEQEEKGGARDGG